MSKTAPKRRMREEADDFDAREVAAHAGSSSDSDDEIRIHPKMAPGVSASGVVSELHQKINQEREAARIAEAAATAEKEDAAALSPEAAAAAAEKAAARAAAKAAKAAAHAAIPHKLRKVQPDETDARGPWVVVIRNATRDLSAIYRDALPRFVLPRTAEAATAVQSAAGQATRMMPVRATVNVRTATASAAVSVPVAAAKAALAATARMQATPAAGPARSGAAVPPLDAAEGEDEEKDDVVVAPAAAIDVSTPAGQLAKFCTTRGLFGASRLHVRDVRAAPADAAAEDTATATSTATAAGVQSGMVVCRATTPDSLRSPALLRKALVGVPGFEAVWRATGSNGRVFNAVFRTEADAFAAKTLLDEFEADSGLKVSLQFSDAMHDRYIQSLAAANRAGDEEFDVQLM